MNSAMSRFIGAALAISSALIPSTLCAPLTQEGDFFLTNGQETTVEIPENTTSTFLLDQFFSNQFALGGAVISILPCAVAQQNNHEQIVVEWVPESTSSRQIKKYSLQVTVEGEPICFARGYNVSVGQCAYREATDNPRKLSFDRYFPNPQTGIDTEPLFVNSTSNILRIRTKSGKPIAFSIVAYFTLAKNTSDTNNETVTSYSSIQTLPPFQDFARQELRSNAKQVVVWNNSTPSYFLNVTVENVNDFCAKNPDQCSLQVYTVQVANGSDEALRRVLANGLTRTKNWCGLRTTLFGEISSTSLKYDMPIANTTSLISNLIGPQDAFVYISLGGANGEKSARTMVGPMSNTFAWFSNSGSSLKASWHMLVATLFVVLVIA